MRRIIFITAGVSALAMLGGCATSDRDMFGRDYGRTTYASACERDYARNRDAATAAGALLGGAAGAAIADNDATGAAIGAVAGGLIGRAVASREDPCGYGFTGYPYSREYGYWDERRGRWVYG